MGRLDTVTNGRFQVSELNDSCPAMNLKSGRSPGDPNLPLNFVNPVLHTGRSQLILLQQFFKLFNWHWLTKQITLIVCTAMFFQESTLRFCFNSFFDDSHIQDVTQVNHSIIWFYTNITHERMTDQY